jgi:hypothetical protein
MVNIGQKVAEEVAQAVAQNPILITTITLSRLRRKWYESMLSY